MAKRSHPVWVWLPGAVAPRECGIFSWEPGRGEFGYADGYKASAGAMPIDPINLPFTHSRKPALTTDMKGVFGVLRDASPEGFGLDLLNAKYGSEMLDELDRMDLASGDGVGAIEVCAEARIEAKSAFVPPPETRLQVELEKIEPGVSARRVVQRIAGTDDGTSLGGEKPKLTITRESASGTEWWIAKLQAPNDPPFLTAREYVGMSLARRCGVHTADVEFCHIGPHPITLIRRFDRAVTPAGVERTLFASAATLLRLKSDDRDDPRRSYVNLAHELRRWCGNREYDPSEELRELWRRMVVNALVGNYDDHPRNHGVIFTERSWRLSPAYDIVPIPVRNPEQSGTVQAMAINREGQRTVTAAALVASAEVFEYSAAEAWEIIRAMAAQVHEGWRDLYIRDCGLTEEEADRQRSAFRFAEKVVTGQQSVDLEALATRRGGRRGTAGRR
ncbi:type II toxin-antitoxin system HipA family toxin [Paraburkholderia caballeronis]|uniref:Serine/threonine-protein kinase HipA n=1 Tax=Paraburkholderia caballeronis TaxID=416943 RepID=A0A1H7F2K8_9BURK|nr:type II toxin-antitoxin system HipA family toxin [Paraburkholderia caballeronis]PXW23939.1 serine/threonine-protein kinase HipA [Paraburkholderia caballeronis]PXW99703.1 serine/threonine-protein kinase HipA [Paraburkholderia caballeronis]RAJ96657.1 serine/threonine-protein kinase HipA [Paraburkholderia caballeronis]SEE77912.1 serine/threonine-protein kinase HipA [Paraburkholderia caballeronis]SEK20321.1 serine/threonine-protein kinase HipA [Paraburkholderia caballeronis]